MMNHRPWPIPERPWVMRMRWCDLLFAHWPVDPAVLRAHLPAGLELDEFNGRAFVGAVPFRMEDVMPRGLPSLSSLSTFPELNLRTYVTAGGKPGVWFFSLDAGQKLAVQMARRFFHLPYFNADFEVRQENAETFYCAERTHRGAPPAAFRARYRPTGIAYRSIPGTLEHWLTERYCLYSADSRGHLYRGEIDHRPWPLQPAEAEIETNRLADWLPLRLDGKPEMLHFTRSLDVHAWLIERLESK